MKRIRFTEEQIIGVPREQGASAKTADGAGHTRYRPEPVSLPLQA